MDAMIAAEPMVAKAAMVKANVTTVIKVDDLVRKLQSLCSPAVIIAPLLTLSNTSLSAVAPDSISLIGGERTLASA